MANVKKRRVAWGGKRPGAGAKPKPATEVRRHVALVSMNDAERAAIVTAAAGMPLATWIREAALRAARRVRR